MFTKCNVDSSRVKLLSCAFFLLVFVDNWIKLNQKESWACSKSDWLHKMSMQFFSCSLEVKFQLHCSRSISRIQNRDWRKHPNWVIRRCQKTTFQRSMNACRWFGESNNYIVSPFCFEFEVVSRTFNFVHIQLSLKIYKKICSVA